MRPQPHEWDWLDASQTIGVTELARACAISVDELDELIDYGALPPGQLQAEERVFSAGCVATLRTACKLRRDYDLDLFTVALLTEYLTRIEELEHALRSVHARVPPHVVPAPREGPQPWREAHAKG